MKEFESVVLSQDLPQFGLKKGAHGAVVHCYQNGAAYEVEFFDSEGSTIGVFTISRDDIRSLVTA